MDKKLTSIKQFIPSLFKMADKAADQTLSHFRTVHQNVDDKDKRSYYDPVTIADRQAEQVIRNIIQETYPDHGILGEEFGGHQSENEHCWIIDPIDGTRSFIMGSPMWGTLVGLLHKGTPILGMLDQPFTKERFWGDGTRAWFSRDQASETAIFTRKTAKLKDAILTSTCPDFFENDSELMRFMQVKKNVKMVRYGGDCYQYALLALGYTDLVIETGLEPYDILPLVPIIKGAGGTITNWQGGKDLSSGKIIAAGSQVLLEEALPLLAG